MSKAQISLEEQGFRFVFRDGEYVWAHPLEVKATDIDCTDMTDAQFETFVIDHEVSA